jgi:general secretion pathway protein H
MRATSLHARKMAHTAACKTGSAAGPSLVCRLACMNTSSRNGGFTLIELILVLVIAATVSAMAFRFAQDGPSTTELKAGTRQVAAALRLARSEAITQRKEVGFTLSLVKKEFNLTGEQPVSLSSDIDLKLFTAEEYVQDANTGTIQFFPDGSSSGGRVTLSLRDMIFEVDVDWMTGRIAILDEPT